MRIHYRTKREMTKMETERKNDGYKTQRSTDDLSGSLHENFSESGKDCWINIQEFLLKRIA